MLLTARSVLIRTVRRRLLFPFTGEIILAVQLPLEERVALTATVPGGWTCVSAEKFTVTLSRQKLLAWTLIW